MAATTAIGEQAVHGSFKAPSGFDDLRSPANMNLRLNLSPTYVSSSEGSA